MTFLATSANGAQRLAREPAMGPAPIVAGAGARETMALVEQAVDLITNHGAAPESLLVVTDADHAALEFTRRIRNRLNSLGIKTNRNVMHAGTVHSLCLRLLDEHRKLTRMKPHFTVMDQFDQHYFLFQRLNDYRAIADSQWVIGQDASRWNQSQTLLKRLNAVTEQALDPEDLAASRPEGRALLACYGLYLEQLKKANALDFSTIQLEALRLLEEHPDVLAGLRKQLTYLMIDAPQDANTVQKRIFRCLVDERGGQAPGGFRDAPDADIDRLSLLADERLKQRPRPAQAETIPWWLT